jgi:hypothetical protein
MSYSPVINLQSYHKVKDDASLGIPGTDDVINAAMAVIDNYNDSIKGCCLGDGSDVIEAVLWAAFVPSAVIPPPTPSSVAAAQQAPQALAKCDEIGSHD